MGKYYGRFYHQLPVRLIGTDEHLHLLNAEESKHIRRCQCVSMSISALLSVFGFLGYYLPIYWYPNLFPAVNLTLPFIGS
ncbi:MAG: hypothetical protein L0220_00055, partial [Acidobacteria bacterium]|nr:hypothetical protein [Acidobacteriota bacterium]